MNIVNYVYLLYDDVSKECAIVDPAWDISELEAEIEKNCMKLKYILLTHSHYDHINKAEYFTNKYSALTVMSEAEAEYYDFYPPNSSLINDNDTLMLGEFQIKCILTPGHTEGSLCFLCGGFLFSGDTLFTDGCGFCIGKGADSEKMFYSIQKLKQLIPMDTIVYPGHKFKYDIGMSFEYISNYNIYLQFSKKDQFCAFRDRKGQKGLFDFS